MSVVQIAPTPIALVAAVHSASGDLERLYSVDSIHWPGLCCLSGACVVSVVMRRKNP